MDLSWLIKQESIPRSAFLFGFFAIGMWELAAPLREAPVGRLRRWPTNGLFYVATAWVGVLLMRFGAVFAAGDAASRGWGLENAAWLPAWLAYVVWVLAADLLSFCTHWVQHAVPLLWRIHRVHHSDAGFDFTTQLRFHPIEAAFTFTAQAALAWLLAPPIGAMLLLDALRGVSGFATHANASLPASWERRLRLVLNTPDLHRVHHSADAADFNSNYAVVFSFWDRIVGTFRPGRVPSATGIPGLSVQNSARPLYLLLLPFLKLSPQPDGPELARK